VESVTVVPRERLRTRQFALALDGAPTVDPSLGQLTRVAGALSAATVVVPAPSDEFRVALRARLVHAGVTPVRPTGGLTQPAPWRRRLVAASAVLAISTGGAAATAVASTGALPGDRLYEVKRAVENVQLALAPSDLAKGERYLTIASTRMDEVRGLLKENGTGVAGPVLVESLRSTLSDMSDAIAAGTERYFAVYHRTLDPSVLVPLEHFLQQRTAGLAEVRELLPVELLDKQGSMLVELDRIARQVATATGHAPVTPTVDVPAAITAVSTSTIGVSKPSRSANERDANVLKLPLDRTVQALGAAVEAVAKAAETAAKNGAAGQSPNSADAAKIQFTENERVRTGTLSVLPGSATPSHVTVAVTKHTESASARLLGGAPIDTEDVDAIVTGSLRDGLTVDLTRWGGKPIHLGPLS
jgi:hypothetical protein